MSNSHFSCPLLPTRNITVFRLKVHGMHVFKDFYQHAHSVDVYPVRNLRGRWPKYIFHVYEWLIYLALGVLDWRFHSVYFSD